MRMFQGVEYEVEVDVTGWNAEGESVSGNGYGNTFDDAVAHACQRWHIVEVGDAVEVLPPLARR